MSSDLLSAIAGIILSLLFSYVPGVQTWYDALTALSEEIAADPANRELRDERASLLEQVGLVGLAQRERDAAAPR